MLLSAGRTIKLWVLETKEVYRVRSENKEKNAVMSFTVTDEPIYIDLTLSENKEEVRTPLINSEAKVLVPGIPGHHAAIKPAPPQTGQVESKRKLGENEVSIEERLGALDIDTKKEKDELPQTNSFPVLLTQGLESNDFEILNLPDLVPQLGTLYQLMESRVKTFQKLSHLHGKLILLITQVTASEKAKGTICPAQKAKLVYEEESSEEESDDEIADKDSDDNWDEDEEEKESEKGEDVDEENEEEDEDTEEKDEENGEDGDVASEKELNGDSDLDPENESEEE
ncbi:hypothetical protein CB1_001264053 [Camelus ferus]|nr:hypothetical protein CB1_001264053 [Camelus ferus]